MVTKSASKEGVKKVSVKPETKNAASKPVSKPVVKAKPTATKAATAKANEKKATSKVATATPATANKNVVDTVLEIKAKNIAKKAKAPVVKEAEVVEKGAKQTVSNANRQAVKDKMQKAEAKKFMALKEDETALNTCCCCSLFGLKTMFLAWADAFKKIFDYKTRSSRYDFWAFMLISLIFYIVFALIHYSINLKALHTGTEVPLSSTIVYWTLWAIMTFASLALWVRRLHDIGLKGWKGFFRPLTFSALGLLALVILLPEEVDPNKTDTYSFVLGCGILVLSLINFYYMCKTFIAVSFMEGEHAENEYGLPVFADDCTKAKILRYSALYFVISTVYVIAIMVIMYISFVSFMMNGRLF